jgi:hypothetical protein
MIIVPKSISPPFFMRGHEIVVNRVKIYLESVHKLPDLEKDVFPAKAGIQSFQNLLDAGSGPA